MIERSDVINETLKGLIGGRYLEVGSSNQVCFNKVEAASKIDIEPFPFEAKNPVWKCSSDAAFESMPQSELFDTVFIDGLHHCDQVIRDVYNASKHLCNSGVIVLHDCLPKLEQHQLRDYPGGFVEWTGDTWKAQAWLISKFSNVFTVNEDWGCGVILGKIDFDMPTLDELLKYTWADFNHGMMRAVDWRFAQEILSLHRCCQE
jgi:hypothetical protein